jgi:hypothetical protein
MFRIEPKWKLHSIWPRKRICLCLQQRDRSPCPFPGWPRSPCAQRFLLASVETSSSWWRCEDYCSIRRHIRRAGRKLHGAWRLGALSGLERYRGVLAVGVYNATPHFSISSNFARSHDSKAKVWRIDTRACVATHSHGDKPLWTAKWLPKNPVKSEMFALAGGTNAISFYREAAG